MRDYLSYKDGANRDIREVLQPRKNSETKSSHYNSSSDAKLKRPFAYSATPPSPDIRRTSGQSSSSISGFYNPGNRCQKENFSSQPKGKYNNNL